MKIRSALFAVLALPVCTPALAAGGQSADEPAQAASHLSMALTLYAGGVTLGKVDMDATLHAGDYHVVSNLETSGIVNAFWQAQIQATSDGKFKAKGIEPTLYDSYDTNHSGKRQQVSLTYENGNPIRLFAEPKFQTKGYDVKPEEQKATLDPLSAVIFITSGVAASADNPCGVVAPVFDGRRRYNIELSKVKDTTIKMDNGLYKGKATICEMKYKQLAGFKPKIIKENASFPKINAWIATFPSSIPGRTYVVPLRVWADTEYGTVAAVATSLKVDGKSP